MPNTGSKPTPLGILEDIMAREGGYVNHPKDPGGPTNFGVTLRTLRTVEPGATIDDLKNLTKAKAKQIYWRQYVQPFARVGDPRLLALLADSSVHHGDTRVQKWMQQALEVPVDGRMGPESWQAFSKADKKQVYDKVLQQRRQLIDTLGKTAKGAAFYEGWNKRLREFEQNGSEGDN